VEDEDLIVVLKNEEDDEVLDDTNITPLLP